MRQLADEQFLEKTRHTGVSRVQKEVAQSDEIIYAKHTKCFAGR